MGILKSLAISGSRHRAAFDLRHRWAVSDDTYSTVQAKSLLNLFLYQQYSYNTSIIIMIKNQILYRENLYPMIIDDWSETSSFFTWAFGILSVCVSVYLTIATTRLYEVTKCWINVLETRVEWPMYKNVIFPSCFKMTAELWNFFTVTVKRLHQLPCHYWDFTY